MCSNQICPPIALVLIKRSDNPLFQQCGDINLKPDPDPFFLLESMIRSIWDWISAFRAFKEKCQLNSPSRGQSRDFSTFSHRQLKIENRHFSFYKTVHFMKQIKSMRDMTYFKFTWIIICYFLCIILYLETYTLKYKWNQYLPKMFDLF